MKWGLAIVDMYVSKCFFKKVPVTKERNVAIPIQNYSANAFCNPQHLLLWYFSTFNQAQNSPSMSVNFEKPSLYSLKNPNTQHVRVQYISIAYQPAKRNRFPKSITIVLMNWKWNVGQHVEHYRYSYKLVLPYLCACALLCFVFEAENGRRISGIKWRGPNVSWTIKIVLRSIAVAFRYASTS